MKETYIKQAVEYAKELLAIPSPTGYTAEATKYLMKTLQDMGYNPVETTKGAVQVRLGGEGTDGLLLASHVDTLGAMVRAVKSSGRLRVSPIGGLNPSNTETETVWVRTHCGKLYEGTLQLENASVHVNAKLKETVRTWDNVEVVLDEPVKNAQQVKELGIEAGNFVFVEPRTKITQSGYIKSRFLDDKLSAAILLALAKYIKDQNLTPKNPLYLNFTTFEEVGHGGAANLPQDIQEFISVDMGCVGDDLNCDETMVSICAMDSSGPSHYQTVSKLVETAKREQVRYAVDIYPFYGSDADAALRSGAPVRHCVIGPGVYASHGYERSHVQAVEATLQLLAGYVDFCPAD